jgi:hypothetical protein
VAAMSLMRPSPIVVLDSVTLLTPRSRDCVAVTGSHGGVYPAWLAAKGGLRGVLFSDAGVGLESAGIGGLALLDGVGIAAAAVDYRTARIGDGVDILRRGIVSHINEMTAALGCEPGWSAERCARLMAAGARRSSRPVSAPSEGRVLLREALPQIWGVDSNSLLGAADVGGIVVSGSHGGLLGGNPASAVGPDVLAAAFNDAGIGIDSAGISRLPALDERGIAAVTVSASSARIGDARSSWETGIISACNETAKRAGAEPGTPLKPFLTGFAVRTASLKAPLPHEHSR